MQWLKPGFTYYTPNYYPTDLDINGNFVAFQGLYGGKMSVAQAIATYQGVLSKWHQRQAVELRSYGIWAKDYRGEPAHPVSDVARRRPGGRARLRRSGLAAIRCLFSLSEEINDTAWRNARIVLLLPAIADLEGWCGS